MLDIDISLFVIFAIVWLLLLVLKKIFFKPLLEVREKREALIKKNKTAAAKSQDSYEQVLADIEEQIKKTRMEAQAARNALEKDALKKKEEIIADVSKESKKQVEKSKADLEKQMNKLYREMEDKSESLAKNIEKRLMH